MSLIKGVALKCIHLVVPSTTIKLSIYSAMHNKYGIIPITVINFNPQPLHNLIYCSMMGLLFNLLGAPPSWLFKHLAIWLAKHNICHWSNTSKIITFARYIGVAPKKIKVAIIICPSNGDHATCVDRVVGHGKCGYLGNLGINCCIVVKVISICQNGSFVTIFARYGLGGNTKFCQSNLNVDVVCWMVAIDELIYGNKIKLTRHGLTKRY